MSLPEGIPTIIVTGTYLAADGTPCTGSVDFQLSVPASCQDPDMFIMPPPVRAGIGEVTPGVISVRLVRNDSLQLLTPGTFYTVTERVDRWGLRSYPVTLTAALGAEIDLRYFSPT